MVLENCIYATSGFKKSDWEAVGGYDEELIYGMEDWDFWLKILGLGRKVHFLDDEVVFYYRIRSGSRSAKFRKMRDEVLWTYNRICSSNKGIMMRNVEAINSRRLLIEINNLNSRALLIRLIYRIMIKTPFLKNQVNSRFAQLFKKRAAKI